MLLKEFGTEIKINQKKAVFLAPTVTLVDQQSEEIRKHTNFVVGSFTGLTGIDTWNDEKCLNVIESNEVLCFTPDIFNNLVTKQIFKLDRICCIVFGKFKFNNRLKISLIFFFFFK